MEGISSNAPEAKTPTNWTSQPSSHNFAADQSNYNYGGSTFEALDATPQKAAEPERKDIIPANPLLPKVVHPEHKEPPQCPLKDIQFVQLQKFRRFKNQLLARMGDGFDQVGKKNMMRENREKRKAYDLKKGDDDAEAKMDEFTHIIQNIVYARDPKIFDTKSGYVNQRNAFLHENMLDIKGLIRMNEERSGGGAEGFGMRRPPPPKKIPKTLKEKEYEKELEAKARYKLRTLENGQVDRTDKTLLFESRFESGNLYLAQKVSDHEYNVLMQNDINTNGHTQWFFFRVQNTRRNQTATFNIMNFTKPDSLFNFGMKVSVYSEKQAGGQFDEAGHEIPADKMDPDGGRGWFKGGERISYYQNGIKKDPLNYCSKGYYTLSFSYKFMHDDDTVFFAFCFPYTYSDLMQDIYEIESDPAKRAICARKTLCKTLAGNDCEVLTITEKGDFAAMQAKQAVVISARVHPGEVVGSWMMRGVMSFLTDVDNPEAKMLREKFIFKIIPMLNPDGVINGNYRCSLAGCDLNRRWKVPHKNLHPTIWATKRLIKDLHYERGLLLYCDLHGHSRKQNVFMYGCNNKMKPEECRVFPLMLSKLSTFFHFGSCRFGVQKSKESTARVSLYKELKSCPNIFTMEATFSGVDFGDHKGQHMKQSHFEAMGTDLCRTLLIYGNIYVPPELEHLFPSLKKGGDEPGDLGALFAQELTSNKKLMDAGDGDSSDGSDSEPSEDNLPVEEVAKVVPIVDKKQKTALEKILRKKQQDEKDAEKRRQAELAARKKAEESPTRSPSPRERRQLKPQQKPFELKPSETDKKEGKKKPEMKDAQTQTERSDYKRIKQQYLEKQKREKQEYRENIARQNNAPYKSPNGLVDPMMNQHVRKSLQSQTAAQRDSSVPHALAGSPAKHGAPERNLQDMRNQAKYHFNNQMQLQNQALPSTSGEAQRMPFQNQMLQSRAGQLVNQSGQLPTSANVPFPQGNGLHVKTSNLVNNAVIQSKANSPTKVAAPPGGTLMQPNPNMQQAHMPNGAPQQLTNFGQALAGAPQYQQHSTAQHQQRNRNNNTMRTHQAALGGGTPQKGDVHGDIDADRRHVMKGPSSTMSKAGEQILQASSGAQNQGHLNTNSHAGLHQTNALPQSQQNSGSKNQHFGAIHLGGGMSFLKDQNNNGGVLASKQPLGQLIGSHGPNTLGVRKAPDGQLVKTASRGRGGADADSLAFTRAEEMAYSESNQRQGDVSGSSGIFQLKQAQQIAANLLPAAGPPGSDFTDNRARGYSVQLAAQEVSPGRRPPPTEVETRKELSQSQIERNEMESIQLFGGSQAQPGAQSRLAEANAGQGGIPAQPRGSAGQVPPKPTAGAASFDNRALVRTSSNAKAEQALAADKTSPQRMGARGSIDSHGRQLPSNGSSAVAFQFSAGRQHERQMMAMSQPNAGALGQGKPLGYSGAQPHGAMPSNSLTPNDDGSYAQRATVPKQFFKYAPPSGETSVEGQRPSQGRATPPFHSSTAKSGQRPQQASAFRVDSHNPSQKLLAGLTTGSSVSKEMTHHHGFAGAIRGDSNIEQYSERDRTGGRNSRKLAVDTGHKKTLSALVGSASNAQQDKPQNYQTAVGIVGISAFANQNNINTTSPQLMLTSTSPQNQNKGGELSRSYKRQSQGNFSLTSQVYGVSPQGSRIMAQYNSTQQAVSEGGKNLQVPHQYPPQLQTQQQMAAYASQQAQNKQKMPNMPGRESAENSPTLRPMRAVPAPAQNMNKQNVMKSQMLPKEK